jgi:hypothetical protein
MNEFTIKGDIERLHVGPDDAVLFKVTSPHMLTQEAFERISQVIKRQFAGVEWVDRILVIDAATIEVSVVTGAAV